MEAATAAVWTVEQINQARGLYARLLLDRALLAAGRESAMEVVRDKLWRKMRDLGHPFAIEVQPEDLQFREVDEDDQLVRVDCRWNPQTTTAEMRGGPNDGEIVDFRDAGDPIIPLYFPARPASLVGVELDPSRLGPIKVEYRLGGWSEHEHRWVYDYAGES